ncbi:unnamed protein product [Cladocopium goreaui]|uniref:Vesicle-associated membrane protein-associated protein A n=1 Tax=Cladocopium goreaui TaxID=2562237 RepID=A0A9P1D536_9DINO|nr:unnamed protein product [Cladocopium goreaui]
MRRFGSAIVLYVFYLGGRLSPVRGVSPPGDMPMNLLDLEPATTLHFCKTPTNTSPNRKLMLSNKTSGYVAFKVKTTAPRSYLVRPSAATLGPHCKEEVTIILQPPGEGQNHRFLVQAVQVTSSQAVSREQWSEFKKEQIEEQRLNVVLEEFETEPAATHENFFSGSGPVTDASRVPGGEAPADLQVKYDELVQYTLMLEKQKKKLEAEIEELKGSKPLSSSESGGYNLFHILLVALISFLLSYAAKFIG